MINSIIIGSGHYEPENTLTNEYFLDFEFYDDNGEKIEKSNEETIQKFEEITEIRNRKVAPNHISNVDMATHAAKEAIADANINPEELDYLIVAHNYGNIDRATRQVDIMPSISNKVKNKLGIKNNACKPYDMLFGCPGWIEAVILSDQLIKAGIAKNILVIGADMVSRAVDVHDRSAMIFSDGGAAVVLQGQESTNQEGIIHHETINDALDEMEYLKNRRSLNPEKQENPPTISMKGRKVYEYALKKVPALVKRAIDNAGIDFMEVKKVLLHQANAKMDHAMVARLFKLYGVTDYDAHAVAPMTVQDWGNSSVATVPTMFDLIRKEKLGEHQFHPEDVIVMAAVGAGMNINAIIYKFPKK